MQTQRPSCIYISHQDSHASHYSKMNLDQIQAHDGICALSQEKHQIRVIISTGRLPVLLTAQKNNRRLSRLVVVLREDKTFNVFPSWQQLKELTFQEAEEVVKRPQARR